MSVPLNVRRARRLELYSAQRLSRQKLLKGNVQKTPVKIFISHSFGTKRGSEEGGFTQNAPPHRDVSRDR